MAFSLRQGMAAIFGLALITAGLQAGEPAPVAIAVGPDAVLVPPPPVHISWFKAHLQRHNCCCSAHHNDLGCTSGDADCKFIFGSCRTFYSEPCFGGPSPYKSLPPKSTRPGGCGCQ